MSSIMSAVRRGVRSRALMAGVASVLAVGASAVAAGPATADEVSAQYVHYGQGTWSSSGLGACGWNTNDSQLTVAVSSTWYKTGEACGKQLRVRGPQGVVYVTIVDRCSSCGTDDLDFSPAAFRQIAGSAAIADIRWVWA